jgi:serine/threonine protein kinase
VDKPRLTAKAIFDHAHEITDFQQRRTYLDQACDGNAELRQQVEALLAAYEQAGRFLQQPAAAGATSDVAAGQWFDSPNCTTAATEGPGTRLGPYKLLQQVGEGGMGIVWMAEQQEPIKRLVAVKVVKAGMDSAQVIARFEAERQALALMDHPNIAKVLDANTTSTGRPYFVMELVKGIPITRNCDEQRLSPKQRLELFVPVCQAVQHAHQKGIIHRDLKPSNVLVASYDGKPVPKVIDFGVAKATGAKLTERTLFTGFGGIIGTLEYMSPEQAELNALDIDTRSDIYALGVMLYELLTGTTPLTRKRLEEAALPEALRLIREEEPPRPSTRLSESKDSLASVSAQRHMEPLGLVKAVRGEVDWIVMKALEKDRNRRYESANGLARDIQRYLADEPVEASPPSRTYRLRKLAWKHRRGLATAAVLLVLLLAGAVVSSVLAVWAREAERQARAAEGQANEQRDRAEKDRNRAINAETEAKRSEADAEAVLGYFQKQVLSAGRPKGMAGGQGKDVTLRQAVDAAEPAIAHSFQDRPLVEASIRSTLGVTYWHLGDFPQAIQQHERALRLREAQLGPDHPDTLQARNNLATTYLEVGRNTEGIRLIEQTLQQREAKLGADHPDTLISRGSLAAGYVAVGRLDEAIRLYEQTLQQCEANLGPDHPATLNARNDLATAYGHAGRIPESLRLHEQALQQCEAKFGPDHPDTLACRYGLASAYDAAGRLTEAIRLHEQTLKRREAILGPNHPETLQSRNAMAATYWSAGRPADAIPLFEQLLKQCQAKLGADHPNTLLTMANLGVNYRDAGRPHDAIPYLEKALQRGRKERDGLPPQHLAWIAAALADTYDRAGQFAKSEPLYHDALEQARRQFGTADLRTADSMAVLAFNLLRQHKNAQAEALLRDCLKVREGKQPDAWTTFNTRSLQGEALLGQKKYEQAEPLLLSGYQGMKEREKTIPSQAKVRLTEALQRLVKLYEATDKKDQAAKWRKELEETKSSAEKKEVKP